jgi:hypothetical protein
MNNILGALPALLPITYQYDGRTEKRGIPNEAAAISNCTRCVTEDA